MNILYYDWDEYNGEDCRDAMRRLGHRIDTIGFEQKGFEMTPDKEEEFRKVLDPKSASHKEYDLVYSFNYYPYISELCKEFEIPYVSWVFDCPHYALDSHTNINPTNHIYLFDRVLYKQMLNDGVNTVHYSPLGVNDQRLSEYCKKLDMETGGNIVYQHDVCFIGNLYDNEYNFYDQVQYLPPELKQYIDYVIQAQEKIFGHDLFTDEMAITQAHIDRLREYINFESTGKYDINYDEVIRNILRKKVTVNERRNILTRMGQLFDTVMYTNPNAKPIENVCNMGLVSYTENMPMVFHRSKINLNITLRSITSGIPLRVLDILAAGGFALTSYTPEVEEYFVDGQDLAIARTPEEMYAKAKYYLEHEDERKQIALNGQKKVYENFAYTKLLPQILKVL